MKRLWLKIALIVVVFVIFATVLIAKEASKEKVLAQFLFQSLEAEHYNPQLVNDDSFKKDLYLIP